MKKFLAAALASFMVIGAATGCANTQKPVAKGSIPIVACIGSEPKSIDPALNQSADGATYIAHAFEGLTKTDKNNRIVNGVAGNIQASADGLTYTYTIRSDAKWSDGKPVTAQDFVYAWQRAVNPATASAYSYQLYYIKNAQEINEQSVDKDGNPQKVQIGSDGKPVTDQQGNPVPDPNGKYVHAKADGSPVWLDDLGVKAENDHTLVVTLEAPCSYFGQITASPTLSPLRKDIVEKHPDTWSTDPSTYVGDGPYQLVSWAHSSKMVFTKNPYYYDSKDIVTGELDFLLMDDTNAILSAYKSGSIQLAEEVPLDELSSLVKSGDCKVYGNLATYYLAFNTKKAPLNDEKVREALSLAVDRQYLVDHITKGGQLPAGAYVPGDIPDAKPGSDFRAVGGNFYDPTTKGYAANVKKAKQLLAQAGYPDGKGFPTIELKYNTSDSLKTICEYFQSEWKNNLGITVSLSNEEWSTFQADRDAGNFDIASEGWNGDYVDPMTFLDLFTSGSGNNTTGWSDSQFDALIGDAKKNADQSTRMNDMHQAEAILLKDYPIMPIYFSTDPDLVSPKLKGYVHSAIGYKFLMWAYIDPSSKGSGAK